MKLRGRISGSRCEIRTAAFGVELDHIFKRREAAVVHVRRSARDLAERGRLEGAVVARIAGYREPAFVGEPAVTPRDAGVVELLVSEVRTDVTRGAVRLCRGRAAGPRCCSGESAERSPLTNRSNGESPDRMLRT